MNGHPRIFLKEPYEEVHKTEYIGMNDQAIVKESWSFVDERGRSRVLFVTDNRGNIIKPKVVKEKEEKRFKSRPGKDEDVDTVKLNVMRRWFERVDSDSASGRKRF